MNEPAENRVTLTVKKPNNQFVVIPMTPDAKEDELRNYTYEGDDIPPGAYHWDGNVLLTGEQARKILTDTRFLPHASAHGEDDEATAHRSARYDQIEAVIKDLLASGQMFDTGTWPQGGFGASYLARAFDLFLGGMVTHPFSNYLLLLRHENSTSLLVVSPDPDNKSSIYLCLLTASRNPAADNLIDFDLEIAGSVTVIERTKKADGNYKSRFNVEVYEDLLAPEIPFEDVQEAVRDALVTAYSAVLCFLMMVNTKFVETRRVAAPDKVNKARLKNRKKPLPVFMRVLNEDYVTLVGENTSSGNSRGLGLFGTHASPVPHKRRAHIRHLTSHDVLVREAYVNLRKNGTLPAFGRSHYEVQR